MTPRPVIAPGLSVLEPVPLDPRPAEPLRTGTGEYLQVGVGVGKRLRVQATPAVRRTLAVISRGEAQTNNPEHQRVLELLAPVLRDGDALHRPGIAARDSAAAALRCPETFGARLDARSGSTVEVRGDLDVPARPLLDAVGLRDLPGDARVRHGTTRHLVLIMSCGEPEREPLDQLTRAGTPHLLLRACEGDLVVGPFVEPGSTACLRCFDLHQEDADPGYGALLRDLIRARRHDGVAEPIDSALACIALGLAVGDLVRHVEGDRPRTWSSTILLRTGDDVPAPRARSPHPDCGCTWDSRASSDASI